jgi:hypothetical protein
VQARYRVDKGHNALFVTLEIRFFEGVCVNYRHPGPRRGEPRVGSGPDVAFPADPSGSGGSGAEFREAHNYCEK